MQLVRFMLALSLVAGLGLGGGPAGRALAEEAPPDDDAIGNPGAAYCTALARQCGLACDRTMEPGSAAAAACESRCVIERTACDTRDQLSGVGPWLSDKVEMVDRFMQGFGEPGIPSDGETSVAVDGSCRAEQAACESRCDDTHVGDDIARAGCDSVCAMNRAACEANAGVEAARPFIERETQRLMDFFGDLLGEGEEPTAPPPTVEWPEPNPDGTIDL